MDFHSLTRRELQSLCKLNKIPANITNVAMADALQALHIVEGVEKFMNDSQNEKTANLVESAETIEVSSPKAPNTRCRTSTRQKVKNTETENLPPTATRTTRRTTKQLAGGVKDVLKTPAISSTTRNARSTSSCGNVNNQLNDCHTESLLDQKIESVPSSPATIVTNSQKKVTTASTITLKKESPEQKMKTYSMRSTRLTEKKSAEPRVKKDSEKAVKIKSFSEEVNVTSEEDVSTVESGNPNAQVEDMCNAFEKLDVLPVVEEIDQCLVLEKAVDVESAHKSGEEIIDSAELGSLKQKLDETSNPCEDDKEDKLMMGEQLDMGENDCTEAAIEVASPCEEEKLEQKLVLEDEKFDVSEVTDHLNLVMVQEEQSDSSFDNAGLESGADDIEAIPFNENLSAVSEINNLVPESNGSSTMVDDMILDNTDNPIESLNSDNENNFGEAFEITTKDTEQMSENTVDVIPTVDNDSPVIEEVQELNQDLSMENNVNEKVDADSDGKDQFSVFSVPCFSIENPLIRPPTSETPMTNAIPFKNMSILSDDKENIDSGRRKLQIVFVDEGKKIKKEKDESERLRHINEISIRQLRKQVKALTLKNINSNEEKEAVTTRPALQTICENKLVGGETKN